MIVELKEDFKNEKRKQLEMLKGKDNTILKYKDLCEEHSEELKREERLVTSAFYQMGIELCFQKRQCFLQNNENHFCE